MKLADRCRLLFCALHIPTMKAGFELEACAQTEEQFSAAKAFRRVFVGTLAITVIFVLGMIAMFVFFNPFLDSGTKRYGTVEADRVNYIHNTETSVSVSSLGLEEYGLSDGDRVVIFFDAQDNIRSAYPKEYFDGYTETRLYAILGYAMAGVTLILVYALIICRLTPFGSAWYQYLAKLRSDSAEAVAPKRRAAITIICVIVALLICLPQLIGIINNIQRMAEINEFGRLIKDTKQVADYADKVTENLEGLDEKLESNSGLDKANSASDRIHDIMAELEKGQQ